MRKSYYIIILSVIVLCFAVNAQKMSSLAFGADVRISFVNQEPDPADPGKYVDVRFKIENNGSQKVENFMFEVLPEFPFSLDPGKSAVEQIGDLNPTQKTEEAVIIKYRLKVDDKAVEGDNELRVRYKFDKNDWIEPEPFLVKEQTHDAILSVDSVQADKESFKPGVSNDLKIRLTNKADSVLKNVKVRLELSNVPFIPIGSTNEKSIYQIESKKSYDVDFDLLTDPESKSGVYQVALKIEYYDELGKGYFKNSTIGLVVSAEPDLSVTIEKSDVYGTKQAGEVSIKIVNKGVSNIKFMNVKLMPSGSYRTISNDEVYIGNIDSDDYETADFKIYAESTNQKAIKLPVMLSYKDANNKDFTETKELALNLYSASEAKKFGLKEGNGTWSIVIFVVIALAGIYLYRRWRKRKKKNA